MLVFSLGGSVLDLLPVAPSTTSTILSLILDKIPPPLAGGDFFWFRVAGFLPNKNSCTTGFQWLKQLPGKGGVTLGSNNFRFDATETGFMALGSAAAGLLSTCTQIDKTLLVKLVEKLTLELGETTFLCSDWNGSSSTKLSGKTPIFPFNSPFHQP